MGFVKLGRPFLNRFAGASRLVQVVRRKLEKDRSWKDGDVGEKLTNALCAMEE